MSNYTLRAVGHHAKQHKHHGNSDLILWTEGPPVLLGRAVKEGEGYKYPNTWNSLSSKHCTLSFVEGKWMVTDTSTNGTFIDGEKIGKGNTQELKVGQQLGLSIITPAAGQATAAANFINTVIYELACEDASIPSDQKAAEQGAGKRKQEASPTAPSAGKRQRSNSVGPDTEQMRKLMENNKELRECTEAQRKQLELQETRITQLEDSLAAKEEAHKQKIEAWQAEQELGRQQHQQELARLQEEAIDNAKNARAEAEQEAAAERAKVEQLTQQLQLQQEEAAVKQAQLQQQLDDAKAELDQQHQLVAAQQLQLQERTHQLETAHTRVAEAEAQFRAQAASTAAAEQHAQQLQQQLEDAVRNGAVNSEQLHAAQEALAAVQQQLAAEQAARIASEHEAKEQRRRLAAAERSLAALKEKLDGERELTMLNGAQVAKIMQHLQQEGAKAQERASLLQASVEGMAQLAAQVSADSHSYTSAVAAMQDTMQQQLGHILGGMQVDHDMRGDGKEQQAFVASTQAADDSQPDNMQQDPSSTQPVSSGAHTPAASTHSDVQAPAATAAAATATATAAAAENMPPPPRVGVGMQHSAAAAAATPGGIGVERPDYTQDFAAFPATAVFPTCAIGTAAAAAEEQDMTMATMQFSRDGAALAAAGASSGAPAADLKDGGDDDDDDDDDDDARACTPPVAAAAADGDKLPRGDQQMQHDDVAEGRSEQDDWQQQQEAELGEKDDMEMSDVEELQIDAAAQAVLAAAEAAAQLKAAVLRGPSSGRLSTIPEGQGGITVEDDLLGLLPLASDEAGQENQQQQQQHDTCGSGADAAADGAGSSEPTSEEGRSSEQHQQQNIAHSTSLRTQHSHDGRQQQQQQANSGDVADLTEDEDEIGDSDGHSNFESPDQEQRSKGQQLHEGGGGGLGSVPELKQRLGYDCLESPAEPRSQPLAALDILNQGLQDGFRGL